MTRIVEELAVPVRARAHELSEALPRDAEAFRALYGVRVRSLGFAVAEEDAAVRRAWLLVAQWLVGVSLGVTDRRSSLGDAEEWFVGSADRALKSEPGPDLPEPATRDLVFALLPYVLDPLGPGTRRAVLRDAMKLIDRTTRKRAGIYYTPADLAHAMATGTRLSASATCLDPACGSGVFLRAASAAGGTGVGLFGCDIDPLAGELCAFVLLAGRYSPSAACSPWAQWHVIRRRIATVDALLLAPGTGLNEVGQRARARHVREVEAALRAGQDPGPADEQEPHYELGSLFPELEEGADVLLSNPPYAALGDHPRAAELGRRYASFGPRAPTAASNVYPVFVEHSWRLTHVDDGRASVVVPLSLAASTLAPFRGLRAAMVQQPGRWRLSFFDRAPDALFGDDVKTRNAVVHYEASGSRGIETTDLLRWTSRSRTRFIEGIRHTPLGPTDVGPLIPKLGTPEHVRLYGALRERWQRLTDRAERIDKVVVPGEGDDGRSVYVAPTAYNWLGVVRDLAPWQGEDNLARTGFIRLAFADAGCADAAYATLASRLTFWVWRVEGDGFHVPLAFLRRLPMSLDTDAAVRELGAVGRSLWKAAQREPVLAINKGLRTLAFPPTNAPQLLDEVDLALARHCQVEHPLREADLPVWYQGLVIVDDSDSRRVTALKAGKYGDA